MATLLAVSTGVPVLAQANAIAGADVQMYDVFGPTYYGRRGAAFPNGEVGFNFGHSMCNGGSANLPWTGGAFGSVMLDTFPKIASLLVRESNGRMVQISDRSFCKHSRTAFNFASGPCAPCQSGPSQTWRTGCSDTYSSGFSSLSSLGPTEEIDPWLGTWDPFGSYFDRGVPEDTGPTGNDGIRNTVSNNGDPIQGRMEIGEADLNTPGTFYGQMHLVMIGEPVANRMDNQASREMSFSFNGSSWSGSALGTTVQGPVLTRWTGAQWAYGQNGNDDGRFMVAWKVTGPVNGLWHYEYAVHNLDNNGAGAAFRIPVCANAQVLNAGFHDIDRDPLSDWTMTRVGNELVWQDNTGNNPLYWNTLYNFWFDSDAAPLSATATMDRAFPGPGALQVQIGGIEAPAILGSQYLGDGCGAPAPSLGSNSMPTVPNPSFALEVNTTPFQAIILVLATQPATVPLGNGCTQFLDLNTVATTYFGLSDTSGLIGWSLPIPAGFPPGDVYCQAAQLVNGGPWLNSIALSNGLRLRVGATGCQ
ncbi:MAG: hypothetical protein AB7O84_19860 [Planctomycetota bacterium]